jgi:DNA-binding transcriptional ArsR family regulator
MTTTQVRKNTEQVAKYADRFSAMGTEPRLRIMQLLLSAHPEGLVVGEIQEEWDIPNSTRSHHLDKLKNEDLVHVRRESTFLRYTAIPKRCRNCCSFCTRNAAPGTRPSNRKTSFESANREEFTMDGIDIKEVVRESTDKPLRVNSGGSSCCGAGGQRPGL